MGKVGGTMLIVYTVFKCLDSWYWATDMLAGEGLTFDQMFHGWIYGKCSSGSNTPSSSFP